jgi:hypothetical protein
MALTKEQILTADDLVKEEVSVPEWGGSVFVTTMTAKDRDAFESSLFETKGKETKQNLTNMRARLAAMTIVDENGKRVFDINDMDALGQKAAPALNRIFDVAKRLNGIGQEAEAELTKN